MFHYFCASQHHFLLSSALLLLLLAVLPLPPNPAEVEAGAIRGRPSPKHPARRGDTPVRAQRVRVGNTKKPVFFGEHVLQTRFCQRIGGVGFRGGRCLLGRGQRERLRLRGCRVRVGVPRVRRGRGRRLVVALGRIVFRRGGR